MNDPEPLTPGQQEAQGKIDAIWANRAHPVHHSGHPRHAQGQEEFETAYRQRYPEPAPDAGAGQAPADNAEPVSRPEPFDEGPHATPQTVAELAALPPPAFAPEAEKAGWRWDAAQLPALYAAAEQEGLAPLVRDGLNVVTRLVSQSVDLEAEEHAVIQAWGSRFSSKMDAVDRFEALVRKHQPAFLAELERTGKTEHRLWLEYAARGGELMMDATTAHGERRLKEKYRQWVEHQPR